MHKDMNTKRERKRKYKDKLKRMSKDQYGMVCECYSKDRNICYSDETSEETYYRRWYFKGKYKAWLKHRANKAARRKIDNVPNKGCWYKKLSEIMWELW